MSKFNELAICSILHIDWNSERGNSYKAILVTPIAGKIPDKRLLYIPFLAGMENAISGEYYLLNCFETTQDEILGRHFRWTVIDKIQHSDLLPLVQEIGPPVIVNADSLTSTPSEKNDWLEKEKLRFETETRYFKKKAHDKHLQNKLHTVEPSNQSDNSMEPLSIDIQKIYKQLGDSLVDLKNRRGQISLDNVCAEVINNACLDILRNRKNNSYDTKVEKEIEMAYIACAKKIFPTFSEKFVDAAQTGITQNVEWAEMWNFLRQYFKENHDMNIDEIRTNLKTFTSNKQSKYQQDNLIATATDLRIVKVEYIDMMNILISIEPNVSLKSAELTGSIAGIGIFQCDDPDYKFEIHGYPFPITKVVAHRVDKDSKIVYELV